MPESQIKTKKNKASVEKFISSVQDERRQADARTVLALMKKVTKEEPQMWGASIIGFGNYHYVYESGREGDWMAVGFSPRKTALTLYIMGGFSEHENLLAKLGKHAVGKSCLYIKRLEDVNLEVVEKLVRASVKYIKATYKKA